MKKLFLLFVFALVLPGCDSEPAQPETAAPTAEDIAATTKSAGKGKTAVMLLYRVSEQGVEPYESRTIITDDYIRLDDNNDSNNFALVDRKNAVVYSVSEESSNILVVKQQSVTWQSPVELKHDTQRRVDDKAPAIQGRQVVHYIFRVNGDACQDATIVEGFMMEAVAALAQYRRLLAGQHAITLQNVPEDARNACDLSMHIFKPDQHLQFGLPIHERDHSGFERSLVDYDAEFVLDEKLFVLPAYEQFSIEDMMAPGGQPVEEAGAIQG